MSGPAVTIITDRDRATIERLRDAVRRTHDALDVVLLASQGETDLALSAVVEDTLAECAILMGNASRLAMRYSERVGSRRRHSLARAVRNGSRRTRA